MNSAARLLNQGSLSRGWVFSLILGRFQFALAALTFASILSALSLVYVTNEVRSLNAAIQQSIADRDHLTVEWGQLLLEKSTWLMQARVQKIAEQRLNMVVPNNKSVVMINE